MAIRSYPRATEPHFASLAAALQPVLHQWRQHYDKGFVYIDHVDFAGTTDPAIQAIVDAAPQASVLLDVKAQADALSLLEKAIALTLLDGINVERVREGAAAITPAQFIAQVKAKVDALGS
jgi:hypothetical protein